MTETRMKEESNEREGEMRQRNRSRPRLIPYKVIIAAFYCKGKMAHVFPHLFQWEVPLGALALAVTAVCHIILYMNTH